MRFATLDQWLEWQTVLHDKAIDLGLDRVREVADRLGIGRIANRVITVAGTNGKGSSVAAYENWLCRSGFSVVSYTSPHLLSYNERVKYNLELASDKALCEAFEAVEIARENTNLTYFEYGTLAALYFAQQRQPDFAILEVGLGGRLDAVNIIDADLVHLTPIGLDHQAWLGDDRETIGREKAGVLRDGVAVVLNDPDPPQSVLEEIESRGCNCLRLQRDFRVLEQDELSFLWQGGKREVRVDMPLPGAHQACNLAGVIAGLSLLLPLDNYPDDKLNDGFQGTHISGRLQSVQSFLSCRLFADVGHNQDAARVLADYLGHQKRSGGRVVVLLGMLQDKQPELFVEALKSTVDAWWLLSLPSERGLSSGDLALRVGDGVLVENRFEKMDEALDHALSSLGNQDIMLVTGSFITVELLLHALSDSGVQN